MPTRTLEHLHALATMGPVATADASAVRGLQSRRLQSVVRSAYENVPFWRTRFDEAGVSPDQIKSREDLARLPVTSRRELQSASIESRMAPGHRLDRLFRVQTTGSTGSPLIVYRTPLEEYVLRLFRLRGERLMGLRLLDRCIALRASNPTSEPASGLRLRQWVGRYRQRIVSCQQPIEDMLAEVADIRPEVIRGYPHMLNILATAALREPGRFRTPRLLISGAEVLTPTIRENVRAAFGSEPRETYSAHECNLIAFDSPERPGTLRVSDDSVIVEILRDGRPVDVGERGEVVVTALHSYTMPFIRYRLRDIATRGEHAGDAASPFSTISSIQGRMMDYFRTKDGGVIHGYDLLRKVTRKPRPWIFDFQAIQESEDLLTWRVVPNGEPPQEEMDEIRAAFSEVLGPDVQLDVQLVDEIDSGPGGKTRPFWSRVASEYGDFEWGDGPTDF